MNRKMTTYGSLSQAAKRARRTDSVIVFGNDGYWVVTAAQGRKFKNAGFKVVPASIYV